MKVAFGVFGAVVLLCGALLLGNPIIRSLFGTKLLELHTADRRHNAELLRIDGFDRIYKVRVDGRRVYSSPDFAPSQDLPFRETLIWDRKGTTVVLEIANQRLFGYDAENQRVLTAEQLLAVELPNTPGLREYGFKGEWPGIGRIRRPSTPEVSIP